MSTEPEETGKPRFSGFEKPEANYSKLPHLLIGAFPIIDSLSELKVILYVLRHTWGFKEYEDSKRITIDEFENGRKLKAGGRMDKGTGMSRNAIKDGIEKAMKDGFLTRENDGRDFGRSSFFYRLNIIDDETGGQKLTPSEIDHVKNCPPEGQELPPRGSEVDSRSEKETPERNFERKEEDPSTPPIFQKLLDHFRIQLFDCGNQMNRNVYQKYIAPLSWGGSANGTVILCTPDAESAAWLQERMGSTFERTFNGYPELAGAEVIFVAEREKVSA